MKQYCGRIFTISEDNDDVYYLEGTDGWKFSNDVLEPVDNQVEKPFVPHLEFNGDSYGEIGKETNYIDAVGRKLRVGDVVEVFNSDGELDGVTVIVEEMGIQFAMGMMSECNDKNGRISNGYKFLKKRSFEDMKNGEEIYHIKFVTKEQLKYYTGKVVCIKSDRDCWTVGKIYEIKNGMVTTNEGVEIDQIVSIEDLHSRFKMVFDLEFLEIVE